jgi:hypothetical protein
MWVWTGYRPPIESYGAEPAVRQFVTDVRRAKLDADVNNAFSEGGYVGMRLLVEAIQKVGPFLTRDALQQTLNGMTFASGLTLQDSLSWGAGVHFAAATMQAFEIQYSGTFGGWRAQAIDRDPTPSLGTN